jgi:hypothetical protein
MRGAIDARGRKNVDDGVTVRVGNIGKYSRNTDVKEDSSSHKGARSTLTLGKSRKMSTELSMMYQIRFTGSISARGKPHPAHALEWTPGDPLTEIVGSALVVNPSAAS